MIVKTDIVKLIGVSGITLWPFIFVRKSMGGDAALINHERIHLRQQLEMLVIVTKSNEI